MMGNEFQATQQQILFTVILFSVVVSQPYIVNVYDEYVIKGSAGIFKCHVPAFVKDYVVVTSWIRDDGYRLENKAFANPGRCILLSSPS